MELAQDKIPRRLEAAVEKDGPQQRLEAIRQRGEPLASAMLVLPAAQDEVRAQAKLPGVVGQCPAIHQFCPRLGERPFAEGREFCLQLARQDQLQHGITEEFEPLIGLDTEALLVGD